MELRTYIEILWRRKWIILLATVIITLATVVANTFAVPIYVSSTTLRVATVGSNVAGGRTDIGYTDRLMNTYARIVTGPSVRAEIMRLLDLSARPTLSVESIPGTELLRVNAEATEPETAQAIAATAAQILIAQSLALYASSGQTTQEILSQQIAQTEAELAALRTEYNNLLLEPTPDQNRLTVTSQAIEVKERTYTTMLDQYERTRLNEALVVNAVSIVEPASAPAAPAKPRTQLNLILGLFVGLLTGMILALVRENLDTTLYTVEQIEAAAKLPTIGRVPPVQSLQTLSNYYSRSDQQPQLEVFRRLRVNLLTTGSGNQSKVFLVTSAGPGEGKSTIAANLAMTMAKSGRRVVMMDCNLHTPALHRIFDLPNDWGLTSVLTKLVGVPGVLQQSGFPNIVVITSGPGLPTPTSLPGLREIAPKALADRLEQDIELLGTLEMNALVAQLRQEFDVVILDTPALLSVIDAVVLAPLADHVMLVVEQARAQRNALRTVREQLTSVKGNAVSIVVNRVKAANNR